MPFVLQKTANARHHTAPFPPATPWIAVPHLVEDAERSVLRAGVSASVRPQPEETPHCCGGGGCCFIVLLGAEEGGGQKFLIEPGESSNGVSGVCGGHVCGVYASDPCRSIPFHTLWTSLRHSSPRWQSTLPSKRGDSVEKDGYHQKQTHPPPTPPPTPAPSTLETNQPRKLCAI